jgi:hypothetical protein
MKRLLLKLVRSSLATEIAVAALLALVEAMQQRERHPRRSS